MNLKAVKASLQAKPKETETVAQQTGESETVATPGQQNAFTQRELQEHWQTFFIRLKEINGSPIELMLASAALQLEEDSRVNVLLSSSLQEEPFERLKPKLQHYLRQQLQNSMLSLHPLLAEESGPRRLYTNSEKFNHLIERYPLLVEFKERLGLETDF
ncbi:DNA polymerase III subunits gamma and tau [Flammeovirgaceae bacterium 311]|nr:DNA polymerase III subunits gamma and tau [Flammeovirgaceae bacterium 311]